VADLCRKHGICDGTFYNWKAKYGGLTVNEARRIRLLEDENRRLKHIVAEQALEIQAFKSVVSKNF
jgi:putative transposase